MQASRFLAVRRFGSASLAIVAVCGLCGAIAAAQQPPLVLEATIPLDGVSGRIDHMAVDLARGHLLVAALGNGTVEEIDLASHKVINRITGLSEPQGIAYVPTVDLVVVATGGDGTVWFFHGEDLTAAGSIDLGDDADNVRVDAAGKLAYVGYGSGGLATIDLATRMRIADAPLEGHPEGFQVAPDGATAYVNVPDAEQIAVVDLAAGRQRATWSIEGADSNFPMAIDADGRFLATVFRSPARLVVIDSTTGQPVAQLDTCGDADDVFFDAGRSRLYVSCGAGAVDVFQHTDAGYASLARVETESGGRTALYVPELDRLFVAVRAGLLLGNAKILVFRPM